jgi:hypothetical protein
MATFSRKTAQPLLKLTDDFQESIEMEQFYVPPSPSPLAPHGGAEAAEAYDRNDLGRRSFIQFTAPQKDLLHSTFFGAGAGVSATICGAILTTETHDYVTLGAFGVFAVITVLCCCGIAACFGGLIVWEDSSARIIKNLRDGMEHWRDRFYDVHLRFESAKRGADAGSAGRGTRASYPLPAEVIRFPGDWRA